ncbi:cell division cycle-associated protein 7-like [Venturia canescens]|uniref:cell division cycle-associated protein 7-like n=1 Tax=Venturia canescens TaxID=32260 RepID=UPI001C9CC9B3|nr:cell division cycle-associated protein 7-like [Venturia canescens]
MAEIDYEEIRRKNIAKRQAEFAEFFKELKAETEDLKKNLTEKRKNLSHSNDENAENRPPARKRRKKWSHLQYEPKTHNTRSRARRMSGNSFSANTTNDETFEDNNRELERTLVPKGRPLKVIFPWAKTFEREMEISRMDIWDVDKELAEYDDEDDDSDHKSKRSKTRTFQVSTSTYDPNSIPSIDEITEDMLANVAEKSSGKTYCKYNGTSCHQCRQKTLDTKTVCRSGECIGVRGQFCGPCLRGRYGEDAVKVLKDPNWACPPCRGLCNCSICRTRNGQRPTGILAPVAQEEGYSSVMDYLQATSEDDEKFS